MHRVHGSGGVDMIDKDVLVFIVALGTCIFAAVYAWIKERYSNFQIGYVLTVFLIFVMLIGIIWTLVHLFIRAIT